MEYGKPKEYFSRNDSLQIIKSQSEFFWLETKTRSDHDLFYRRNEMFQIYVSKLKKKRMNFPTIISP